MFGGQNSLIFLSMSFLVINLHTPKKVVYQLWPLGLVRPSWP